jgi:glycerophosphoryl diester phosphodiesterase
MGFVSPGFRERIRCKAGFAEQKVLKGILKGKPAPDVPAHRTFRFLKRFLFVGGSPCSPRRKTFATGESARRRQQKKPIVFYGLKMKRKVINIGHRGAMAYAPENTLKSFARGIELGAQMIELDAHLTRDGAAVVNHNADLKHASPPKGKIAKLTLAEFRSATFRGEPLPTLEDAILLCREKGAEIDIECKDDRTIDEIVRLVRKHDMTGRVLLTDFRITGIARAKRLEPALRTGYLTLPLIYLHAFPAALATGAYSVNPNKAQVNRLYVGAAHRLGLKVIPWTVDEAGEMRRLIELGADGIITNKPDLLAKIKNEMDVE